MSKTLLSFGHGYSARALAADLIPKGWRVIGTTRDPAKSDAITASGAEPLIWPQDDCAPALEMATHILISAGPTAEGDPVLMRIGAQIAKAAPNLKWVGYLSTTAVYGDHDGAWVHETTPPNPSTARGQWRLDAEKAWSEIANLPLHIFRLAGIYGPGRGPFSKVRAGKARQIIKPGQVFSRIHVDDIAHVLAASIARPNPGAVYNLCDDDPAPPQDVIAYAADLLNLPRPPEVAFLEADMSDMARSFYAENKRVSNAKIKDELGVKLIYPDYRVGLDALI